MPAETKSCQRHVLYCDDQRWYSNSWCVHHTRLAAFYAINSWSVTWSRHFPSLIITIVMGQICGACKWSQETKTADRARKNAHFVCLGTTREVCSKNVVIITDRKCHDQLSDQELGAAKNVPPSMWLMLQLYEAHLLIFTVVNVSWIELRFSHVSTVHSQKKSWLCLRRH